MVSFGFITNMSFGNELGGGDVGLGSSPNAVSGAPAMLPTPIIWETDNIQKEIKNFKKVVPVRFEGRNQSDRTVKVVGVVADCSACANPKASVEVVKPGESFLVHAMVRLVSVDGIQRGKLVVNLQDLDPQSPDLKVDFYPSTLSYEIKFLPPFYVVPSGLEWAGDDIEDKKLLLTFDTAKGYQYKSYAVDKTLYSVVEGEKTGNSLVLVIKPLTQPAVPSFLTLTYSSGLSGRESTRTLISLGSKPSVP
jgi:hypothetical protein